MAFHRRTQNYISILAAFICGSAVAAEQRRIVIVVWDGMRPDFVSETNSPALWKLAKEGVTFQNHHSVYLSATNVNGTAIVTGAYPSHSGVFANHIYRPDINDRKTVDVEEASVVRKGDEISGGKYLNFPTLAEIIRANGGRTVTATAKTIGLLQDRHLDFNDKNSVLVFSGNGNVPAALGPFPRGKHAFSEKDNWTTDALTKIFWKDRIPTLTLLWLSQPDGAEHETAPGSKEALTAIKLSDDHLAAVLAELDRLGVRANTDVFVVSDHGFSTIQRSNDLRQILAAAKFDVSTKELGDTPKPGQIVLCGNGGSVLFYVIDHDATIIRRLVEFLQQSDFAGVILTKQPMEGTFTLEQAKIDTEHAPDVVLSFRWNDGKSQFGVPGMLDADWNRPAGEGTHASLSRFDLHNTLIAAGPDFRRGETDLNATGNVDLAPTILHILGIREPKPMDGRVLAEVMENTYKAKLKAETETLEATKQFPSGKWRQTLKISRLGSTTYLDEGNGAFAPQGATASKPSN